MRPTRYISSVVAAAGLSLATITAAAPPALASNNSGSSGAASAASVTVSPSTVQPGDTVTIQLDCSAYANPHPVWRSTSAFADPVNLQPMSGQPGFFTASATVSATLTPGSFTVSGACTASDSNSQFQGQLVISASASASASAQSGGFTMPQGTARTGGGGSITGGDTASVGAGAALLAAAGLLTLRRRRTRDGR